MLTLNATSSLALRPRYFEASGVPGSSRRGTRCTPRTAPPPSPRDLIFVLRSPPVYVPILFSSSACAGPLRVSIVLVYRLRSLLGSGFPPGSCNTEPLSGSLFSPR